MGEPIPLDDKQSALVDAIKERLEKARKRLAKGVAGEDVTELVLAAGDLAHELHGSLADSGFEPRHHGYMVENRDLKPSDPDFYKHIHPLEDLLAFIDDRNANDDPEDQTIDVEFQFRVYSQRWEHDDAYQLRRTSTGWVVYHLTYQGECDKRGAPVLFEAMQHDSIEYPFGLGGWLEWLWYRAREDGLTAEDVQKALDNLGSWVSVVEKQAPSGGVWEGYK